MIWRRRRSVRMLRLKQAIANSHNVECGQVQAAKKIIFGLKSEMPHLARTQARSIAITGRLLLTNTHVAAHFANAVGHLCALSE